MPKRGAPRLPEFTAEEIVKIETMAGYGLTNTQIAEIHGISLATLKNRFESQPELLASIKKGRAKALLNVAQSAYQQAMSGKVPAMTMFYLKCRGKWREKDRVEVTGKGGEPIQTNNKISVTVKRLTNAKTPK